ncbi:hypothetical protein [Chitinophaga sp. MM2321]|uniref:hypothetical protein n=1 Tax=Chitinophaga sp. MM2321 TaxID=3137178 RepID=UPI0032D5A2F5
MGRTYLIASLLLLLLVQSHLSAQNRWELVLDRGISWKVGNNDVHTDHIEMSGKQVSVILTYGTDKDGMLVSSKQLIFPMLRTIPNNTHAHTMYTFGTEISPIIKINGRIIKEKVKECYLKGWLRMDSDAGNKVQISRIFAPSVDQAFAVEQFILTNNGEKEIAVEVEDFEKNSRSSAEKSVYGVYELKAGSQHSGVYKLASGDSIKFSMVYSGRKITAPAFGEVDVTAEIGKRQAFVEKMFGNLRFSSPDPVINRMFDFAKIRAMESIFATKGGLVHSPGGGSYYAAIWANDQAEYANPFFAYSGYETAIESGLTSWRWFSKWMNPAYKPIPSSIIAEGDGYWNGAGDRGDQAMIAYGASRFALALGDKAKAKEIWPLIAWCLEYCKRQINKDGVVTSDSDELEGRFPAGKANLSTSSLYYDALIHAAKLGRDLGVDKKQLLEYEHTAAQLKQHINTFFSANVEGFDTYRYYAGNTKLRSWICVPLTMNIFDRAKGTLDALFSPLLWTDDGLLTQSGDNTFWDRSTLYGLRGAFAAGATEKALLFLTKYSNRRLLGAHVPYAVEAWPEGNQRHLSAESALYCRTITEGLFGFEPEGLSQFSVTPHLPEEWKGMSLKNMVAFGGKSIDILIERAGKNIQTNVYVNGKLHKSVTRKPGTPVQISM